MIEFTISTETLRLIYTVTLTCLAIAIIACCIGISYLAIFKRNMKLYEKLGILTGMTIISLLFVAITLDLFDIISFAVV